MRARRFADGAFLVTVAVLLSAMAPGKAVAHCDTLDGPVVQDAMVALETGDVTPVLKWVSEDYEQEIRNSFETAMVVRQKGEEARKLADMYFFETLVRIHRAGEGAPYTGLKPAGSVEEPIAAADNALEEGSAEQLTDNISGAVREAILSRFTATLEGKKHAGHSVEAGRKFVEAYVDYVHFVEALHNLVSKGGAHGQSGGADSQGHAH